MLSVPQGTVTERNCFVAAVKVSRESLDVSLKTQLLLMRGTFILAGKRRSKLYESMSNMLRLKKKEKKKPK